MSETKKITSLKVMGFDDKYVFRDDHARVYHDLTEIDATITSLHSLCLDMPTHSILIVDETGLGEIDVGLPKTQGKPPAGIYVFIKGSSKSRFSMMFLSTSYSANEPGLRFGNYAAEDQKINWSTDLYAHLTDTNNPHEVHATQIIKSITVTSQVNNSSNANTNSNKLKYNSTRILSISAKSITSDGTTTSLLCTPFKPSSANTDTWWCHISDTSGTNLKANT
jgi:hypothetical protein